MPSPKRITVGLSCLSSASSDSWNSFIQVGFLGETVVLVGQPRKPTVPWYSQTLLGHASCAIAASILPQRLCPTQEYPSNRHLQSASVILSKCLTWLRRDEPKYYPYCAPPNSNLIFYLHSLRWWEGWGASLEELSWDPNPVKCTIFIFIGQKSTEQN